MGWGLKNLSSSSTCSCVCSSSVLSHRTRWKITYHPFNHNNLWPQVTTDEIRSEKSEGEYDEIHAIQDASCFPCDIKKPQDKTNEGDCVSKRVHNVYVGVKI